MKKSWIVTKRFVNFTKSQKDLAKAKVERVIEAYDTVIGKRENKADYYNAKQELRVSQGIIRNLVLNMKNT